MQLFKSLLWHPELSFFKKIRQQMKEMQELNSHESLLQHTTWNVPSISKKITFIYFHPHHFYPIKVFFEKKCHSYICVIVELDNIIYHSIFLWNKNTCTCRVTKIKLKWQNNSYMKYLKNIIHVSNLSIQSTCRLFFILILIEKLKT